MGRRQRAANTETTLMARGGTHRLTHRAMDTEAGLPNDSTPYYARFCRGLIRLMMEQFSTESRANLIDIEVLGKLTVRQITDLVGRLAERLTLNDDAQATRFVLMFGVRGDDKLRREFTVNAPVRCSFDEKAIEPLHALGVADPEEEIPEFVTLVNAALMYRVTDTAPIDPTGVVETYLGGPVRRKPTVAL